MTSKLFHITYCIVIRGEPSHGPRVTCAENFVKSERVVFARVNRRATLICERTDRQTQHARSSQYFAPFRANSASCPQRDGKWVPAKWRRFSAAGE